MSAAVGRPTRDRFESTAVDAVRQPVKREARLMCLVTIIDIGEVHVYHLAAMFDASSLLLRLGFLLKRHPHRYVQQAKQAVAEQGGELHDPTAVMRCLATVEAILSGNATEEWAMPDSLPSTSVYQVGCGGRTETGTAYAGGCRQSHLPWGMYWKASFSCVEVGPHDKPLAVSLSMRVPRFRDVNENAFSSIRVLNGGHSAIVPCRRRKYMPYASVSEANHRLKHPVPAPWCALSSVLQTGPWHRHRVRAGPGVLACTLLGSVAF